MKRFIDENLVARCMKVTALSLLIFLLGATRGSSQIPAKGSVSQSVRLQEALGDVPDWLNSRVKDLPEAERTGVRKVFIDNRDVIQSIMRATDCDFSCKTDQMLLLLWPNEVTAADKKTHPFCDRGLVFASCLSRYHRLCVELLGETGPRSFCEFLYLKANVLGPEDLRKEYLDPAGDTLVSAFIRSVDYVASKPSQNQSAPYDVDLIRQADLRDSQNTDLPLARDLVAKEYDLIRKTRSVDALYDFFNRRSHFGQAPQARAFAFRLYCEKDETSGYREFIDRFGVNCVEFPLAVERRRLSALRDVVLQAETLPAEATPIDLTKGDSSSKEAIRIWDELIMTDPQAFYCGYALRRTVQLACKAERDLAQGAFARAEKLRQEHSRLTNQLRSNLNADPLSIVVGGLPQLSDVLRPENVALLVQRERIYRVLEEVYPESADANDLATAEGINLSTTLQMIPVQNSLLTEMRQGFKETQELTKEMADEIKQSLAKGFDKIDAELLTMNETINENQKETQAALTDVKKALKEANARLSTLQDSVESVASTVGEIKNTVDRVERKTDQISANVNAINDRMFPITWPGKDDTDKRLKTWKAVPALRNALAGIVEGEIRKKLLDNGTQEFEGSDKKEQKVAGVTIYSYSIDYQGKITPNTDNTHFNCNDVIFGVDKISRRPYLFVDITLRSEAKCSFRVNADPVFGSGNQNCNGWLVVHTKVKIDLDIANASITAHVDELNCGVESLEFSGELLNLVRHPIQDKINEKIGDMNLRDKMETILNASSARFGPVLAEAKAQLDRLGR